ncbi:hypothetical protein GCM10008171_22220 [Methylopila jiangsuensis]|uniref:Uncharacterized protein n=1 Tax=Methylopila jiangsuensis TaxID=586230 RepID=A0A9W6JIP7_9HYPH|nr:hypothetical protein GCM10008171_22220 [Methylopila jiangsuensis]
MRDRHEGERRHRRERAFSRAETKAEGGDDADADGRDRHRRSNEKTSGLKHFFEIPWEPCDESSLIRDSPAKRCYRPRTRKNVKKVSAESFRTHTAPRRRKWRPSFWM